MLMILLVIIYIAFISLGLPDSLLGSAWTSMHLDLHMPISAAGIVSMMISGGTIISSLMSAKVIKIFGTGKVTLISVAMTAGALLGFSYAPSFIWLCILALPLGLGAGAVDSGLNNFVALHYKAQHMSWLHCFWGIGATSGPLIMALSLPLANGWRKGYLTISIIQIVLVVLLFLTLPLWKKVATPAAPTEELTHEKGTSLLSLPVVKASLLSFFCYCAVETTTGLWGSTYLVSVRGLSTEKAAQWISLYYLGITLGRLFCGFITAKFTTKSLVRMGQASILIGILLFFLPVPSFICMLGFTFIGLGCAPIFPSLLHDTPNKVGVLHSQSMMGIQMASAYVGSTLMPPLFGFLAAKLTPAFFPLYLLILTVLMIFASEKRERC